MANGVYHRGYFQVGNLDLDSTAVTLRNMLVTTGYVFSAAHNFVDDGTTSDPASYEIAVGGYSRQDLVNKALFEDDANGFAGLDADNLTYSALAAGATVGANVLFWYSSSGGSTADTAQALVAYYQLTATPTNGGDISVNWASTSAGSVLKITSTS